MFMASLLVMASAFDAVLNRLWQYRLTICLVILFCYSVYRLVARRFFHLSAFPGPWWAAFSRIWLLKTLASEDSPGRYIEVNERYGTSLPFHIPDAEHAMICTRLNYQGMRHLLAVPDKVLF